MAKDVVKTSSIVKGNTSAVRAHLDAVERARTIYLAAIKRAEADYFERIKHATELVVGGEQQTEQQPLQTEAEQQATATAAS
jgi:hypothetical protein